MKITLISDLHNKYKPLTDSLSGGDLIICSGDMTSVGHIHEIEQFCKWFSKLDNYKYKIFISGNHDWGFQKFPKSIDEMLEEYPDIIYLEDSSYIIMDGDKPIKIWGSPWQPFFCNWAFNLPKNGEQLMKKWDMIPYDTDILITHGPPFGILDQVIGEYENLGCELLSNKIKEIKPKINVFGHIHSGYGYVRDDYTHYFNASILDENYIYRQKPMNIDWNIDTNEIEFY